MQITYANLELGDDAGGKAVSAYSPEFELLTNRAAYVGGERAQGFARKNRGRTIGFSVSRAESSHEAAFALGMSHPESLPDTGLLVLIVGTTGYQCAGAVLESCKPAELIGKRIVFEYRFFCRQLTLVDATEGDTLRDRDYRESESTTGTMLGGWPGYGEADMDTIEDS